jgi:outer membrane protein OmpA-like peptidoglycan-associated protein
MPGRFEFQLENELEQEREEEYPIGLEATPESGPFPHLESEEEWEQSPVRCPAPTRETVSGFSRYSNAVPAKERAKVTSMASLLVRSFRPGCKPIRTVRLVGHADRDVQRGPAFERRISAERALAVQQPLKQLLNNPLVASRIAWQASGIGATSLVVPNPRTEAERARNRRVEIWLNGEGPEPSSPDYIRWVQGCLNQVLGLRLAVTGVMEPRTRNAVRAFQQRQGLAVDGIINPQTVAVFINACGFPQITPGTMGWLDAPASGASTRESNITAPSTGWNSDVIRVSRIDRIPLDGLTTANPDNDPVPAAVESAVQRAIALRPYYLDQRHTKIDALLHLHGFNVGYRQRAMAGGGCTRLIGSVRDIDCDREEQQLEAWGFSGGTGSLRIRGECLIAVLAQGTHLSFFGTGAEGMLLDPNAYLKEIFQKLIARSALPQNAQPARTVLSGHSGAGRPLSKMLESGNVPSNVGMVIIFDAINSDVQLNRYIAWVRSQITNDIGNLTGKSEADQMAYLSRSMRFIAYYSDSDFYRERHRLLENAIKNLIARVATVPPLASDGVVRALSDSAPGSTSGNYKVIHVGGDHDGIIGNPTPVFHGARPLEVALARFPSP